MSPRRTSFWQALGPAIIVACVVLGPGSILTSSKVGVQYGYQMVWVMVGAGVLMAGTMVASTYMGLQLQGTPGRELTARLGYPASVVMGITVFLIAACFQFSNNLGVLASIEPLFETTVLDVDVDADVDADADTETKPAQPPSGLSAKGRAVILIGLNGFLVACLYWFRSLYVPVERLMMVLVGLMLAGFTLNLVLAQPSILQFMAGVIPSLPSDLGTSFFPYVDRVPDGDTVKFSLVDRWMSVQGLIATTFSIAGGFYQAYLVREKSIEGSQLRQRLVDIFAGISVLVGISLMIMATSASVLSGRIEPGMLNSAGDVARQLEPLFGTSAKLFFCIGIFAAAFSSFLINSVIGGTMLSDGLNLDARIDSPWTKAFTVLIMLVGMTVALWTDAAGRVPLIIFAQGVTVLGGPFVAFVIIYLCHCAARQPDQGTRLPMWVWPLLYLGATVVVLFAVRTAVRIGLQVTFP